MTDTGCIAGVDEVGELYARHAVRVRQLVRLDVGACDAVVEDACQIAWMRLMQHWQRVRRESATRWVARVARHEAYRQLRLGARASSLDAEEPSAVPDLLADLVERRVRLQSIRALPERQRRVLWLTGLGLSYAEIAGATGDSRRTVERQLTRARTTLRRAEAA